MNRRPNRAILILASLFLIALGLLSLLAAGGIVPLEQPAELYMQMAESAEAYPWAWLLGLIAGGLILAAVGAWLVSRQLRLGLGGRLGTVVIQRQGAGRTTLQAAAAAKAATADLRSRPPIADSGVRMVTFGSRPRLLVDLDISAETDPHRALEAAEEVYKRLARVLGVDAVNVDTRLRPRPTGESRVE
jgi:hypothetical protein